MNNMDMLAMLTAHTLARVLRLVILSVSIGVLRSAIHVVCLTLDTDHIDAMLPKRRFGCILDLAMYAVAR